jgi:hypothetical protein
MNRTLRACLAGLVVALPLGAAVGFTRAAYGFNSIMHWGADADGHDAGGAFLFGTGSRADWGITCAMCHVDDAGQQGAISLVLTPTPAWEVVNGVSAYKPGATYVIDVAMLGAHLGTGLSDDQNTFALTAEDQSSHLAGAFTTDTCPAGPASCVGTNNCPADYKPLNQLPPTATTYTYGATCATIFALPRESPALTAWKVTWTAPAAGTGKVTLFYGAVDGDSGNPTSSLGDDVTVGTVKLDEGS